MDGAFLGDDVAAEVMGLVARVGAGQTEGTGGAGSWIGEDQGALEFGSTVIGHLECATGQDHVAGGRRGDGVVAGVEETTGGDGQ